MAFSNEIELAEAFLPILDEKYRKESVTAVLDMDEDEFQEGRMADTIYLPSMVLEGLADYDRNAGYGDGDVEVSWEAHTFTQDRGKRFQVDAMDDLESMEVTFGNLSGQFIRNHVTPEIDTYRFAEMYNAAANTEDESVDETDIVEKIDVGHETMDNAEVPDEGRVIFVNPTAWRYLKNSDVISRELDTLENTGEVERQIYTLDGTPIFKVPQSRFNTEVTMDADDGYDTTGEPINFMIVHTDAVHPIAKHRAPKIINPEANQSADAYLYAYRIYHDIFVPQNKTDGIYVSYETEA